MTRTFTSISSIVARPDGLWELVIKGVVINKFGDGLTYEEAERILDEIEENCQRQLIGSNRCR